MVLYRQHGRDGEPILDEGQEPPAPCPGCGRPARVLPLVVIDDPEFYGNAERLGDLRTERAGPVRLGETELP